MHRSIVLALLALLCTPVFSHAQVNFESQVREYFADVPALIEIARCESRFRQFTDAGNPLYGGYLGKMVGIFQFYKEIHEGVAQGLGFDLETVEGNLGYARYLYEQEGTDPWLSSIGCWGGTPKAEAAQPGVVQTTVEVTIPAGSPLSKDLSLGMIDPEIRTMQRILNNAGFALATEGPGSPGNETEKFGALTRSALRQFQCAKGIVCEGDEYSTGYGFVGPRTRAALLAASGGAPIASAHAQQPSASSPVESEAEQIAALQKQIADLMKILEELTSKQAT